jgi:cobalt-zinc-cadmium efflux system membrane fusion protein
MVMTGTKRFHWVLCAVLALAVAACSKGGGEAETAENRSGAAAQDVRTAAGADSTALCPAHAAPASLCFICDGSLRDSKRLWCAEHARYEDRCWLCHPELRDASRIYCEEHGLYEDECFLCHPELRTSNDAPANDGVATGLMCKEHGVPEAECGICHPDLAANLSPGQGLKIRFPSGVSAARAGVAAEPLGAHAGADVFTATGELDYNMNRLARIATPVDGVVKSVHSDVGAAVQSGMALVSVSSPRVAEVRSELIRALSEEEVAAQARKRQEQLFEQKVSSARELDDARARHESARAVTQAARQTLRDLGLSEEDVERFARNEHNESLLPLRAPFPGTVVDRSVALGDVVEAGDALFVVADLDVMWLKLSVTEAEAVRLRVGDRVDVRVDSLERELAGRVTWISAGLDPATRMAQVRAEIPNLDRRLRAGTFVTARVVTSDDRSEMSIDRDAVHLIDGRRFVFVRLSDDLYELRAIDARPASGDRVVVLAGLDMSDVVVTKQSYLVKSEFQKSRLGAGCVD